MTTSLRQRMLLEAEPALFCALVTFDLWTATPRINTAAKPDVIMRSGCLTAGFPSVGIQASGPLVNHPFLRRRRSDDTEADCCEVASVDQTEASNAVFTAEGRSLATGPPSPLTVIPSLSMIKAWKRSTATNCVAISKR